MKKYQLLRLLKQYFKDTLSEREKTIISEWEEMSANTRTEYNLPNEQQLDLLEQKILDNIHQKITRKPVLSLVKKHIYLKIAASVLLICSFSVFFLNPFKNDFVTVIAPKGKIMKVQLPDSSSVWINAGGIIKYPKTFEKNRDVFLVNGEAFFDVKHHNDLPFIVHYAHLHVKVLGTAFNVKAYKELNDIRVTVIRGRVEVGSESKTYGILTPDKEIVLDKKDQSLRTRTINSQKVSSWKTKDINLYDVPFKDLVLSLENIYDVKITYPNEVMDKVITTVHFNSDDKLQRVLEIIKMIHDINYTIEGKEVLLTK